MDAEVGSPSHGVSTVGSAEGKGAAERGEDCGEHCSIHLLATPSKMGNLP